MASFDARAPSHGRNISSNVRETSQRVSRHPLGGQRSDSQSDVVSLMSYGGAASGLPSTAPNSAGPHMAWDIHFEGNRPSYSRWSDGRPDTARLISAQEHWLAYLQTQGIQKGLAKLSWTVSAQYKDLELRSEMDDARTEYDEEEDEDEEEDDIMSKTTSRSLCLSASTDKRTNCSILFTPTSRYKSLNSAMY